MEHWGTTAEGPAHILTIDDGGACRARLCTHGARLVELWVPGSRGQLADIVLGHDRIEPYLAEANPYFGATCGRYANRIANGRFDLNGQTVQLDRNEGPNTLHGGRQGFDSKLWTVIAQDARSASFALHSPDGDMGFPGALDVTATYAFTAPARLQIVMTARVAGADTVVNLVNHAYFNMAGQGSGPVHDQLLQIAAETYLPVDAALLPLGAPQPVAGTAFDFRTLRAIGAQSPEMGFDHNLCLTDHADPAVVAIDPASGRGMRLITNQPGVQFYTGRFIAEGLPGKAGAIYGPHAGFTLETQAWPDSPNRKEYPAAILRDGASYQHDMQFDFFAT